jgi:putative transposase
LLRRCRDAGGTLTALLSGRSSGGRDTPRMVPTTEATRRRIVEESYLTPQRRGAAGVMEEVIGRCRKALTFSDLRRGGEEHPEAKPVYGHRPPAWHLLDLLQIDHTPVDLILVHPVGSAPIGRPRLTCAIVRICG